MHKKLRLWLKLRLNGDNVTFSFSSIRRDPILMDRRSPLLCLHSAQHTVVKLSSCMTNGCESRRPWQKSRWILQLVWHLASAGTTKGKCDLAVFSRYYLEHDRVKHEKFHFDFMRFTSLLIRWQMLAFLIQDGFSHLIFS